ncbi:unnamed protein product [Thelazia callipaeda]|uniref:C-CAP/cofactor C-like domain-containing protein n=1 Tax=Thelazia callipaeda TaxID=103827 RepID=A0A0N5D310_THECL|nr:unnamed protein product [Thelazia callipaeda]
MLQDAGMLNQWIMANNPEDAGRNFAHSFENTIDVESEYLQVMDDDAFTLNSQLRKILADENNSTTTLLNIPFSDDTLSNDANKKFTKPCQIDENKFIPVGKCISQGKQEFNEYSTLCTSCRGIYILSKMCFPRFINALQCEKQNKKMGCIFDKITKQAHGSCHMRTLTFQVLWNRGSENCQDWSYEYIQVPSGCECHLKTMSSLLQAIKPFMS